MERIELKLFGPETNEYTRAGVAGAAWSLDALKRQGHVLPAHHAELYEDRLVLEAEDLREFLLAFVHASLNYDETTKLIKIAAHQLYPEHYRYTVHRVITNSMLSNIKHISRAKPTPVVRCVDDETSVVEWVALIAPEKIKQGHAFAHGRVPFIEEIVKKHRSPRGTRIKITKALLPAAEQMHSALGASAVRVSPETALSLIFLLVSCIYYDIKNVRPTGPKKMKRDERRLCALVLPHIVNLKQFVAAVSESGAEPLADAFVVHDASDAALRALLMIHTEEYLDECGVDGCTTIVYGDVKWIKSERSGKAPTDIFSVDKIDVAVLRRYRRSWDYFPARYIKLKEDPEREHTHMLVPSQVRGLVAENTVSGRPWFTGFERLVLDKHMRKNINFERKGIYQMVADKEWTRPEDRMIFDTVHDALRRCFGKAGAKAKGNAFARFDKEVDWMFRQFKHAGTSELFTERFSAVLERSGWSKVMSQHWQTLYPYISGAQWRNARSAAVAAVASYPRKEKSEAENEIEVDDDK